MAAGSLVVEVPGVIVWRFFVEVCAVFVFFHVFEV